MTSPTAFDNTLVVLQLIEAVLKIQPTVGAVLHAVKKGTQLLSFLRDAESLAAHRHQLKHPLRFRYFLPS